MTWKEQLERKFGYHLTGDIAEIFQGNLEDFISTQIIEKLIADIPDEVTGNGWGSLEGKQVPIGMKKVKQQLKSKWL